MHLEEIHWKKFMCVCVYVCVCMCLRVWAYVDTLFYEFMFNHMLPLQDNVKVVGEIL